MVGDDRELEAWGELEVLAVEEPGGDPVAAGQLLYGGLVELAALAGLGGADEACAVEACEVVSWAAVSACS